MNPAGLASGIMVAMEARLIFLERGDKRAWVYPEQGFTLHGFEQDTPRGLASVIYQPARGSEPWDRRYGNPVLFPAPSATTGPQGPNTWEWNGRTLPMPFHGI